RLAARMEPAARRAFLAAVRGAAGVVSIEGLTTALASGQMTEIEAQAQLGKLSADLQRQILPVIGRSFALGAQVGADAVPDGPAVISYGFDLRNPEAIRWVRERGAELVTNVSESTRSAIRALVEVAQREGRHPHQTAREIREVIGLLPRQAEAVQRFRERLASEGADDLGIERRANRYADAQLRQRSITIARTETLMASGQGQQSVWEAATAQGLLNPAETQRVWLATSDDITDLETCFPAPTKILTLDGWKKISRVRVGEYVLTHADRYRRVVKTTSRHHNGMSVQIVFSGRYGLGATATFGHRIRTKRGWVIAEDLTTEDEIAVYAIPCERCGRPVPRGTGAGVRFCPPCYR
ncbi:MAG: Hint domain-containing protein, partial [Patescibacteria group bacterium]